MVEGQVTSDEYRGDGSLQIRGRSVIPFAEARQLYARNITLRLQDQQLQVASLQQLHSILRDFVTDNSEAEASAQPAACEIVVHYERDDLRGDIILGDNWRVKLDDELLNRLRRYYGENRIALNYI